MRVLPPPRLLAWAALAGALTLGAAACGGSTSPSATPGTPLAVVSAAGGTVSFNGAFGTVASVSGTSPVTLEVQNPSTGQTTVTVSSSATVLRQVAGSAADVKPGSCVQVIAAGTASGVVTAATVVVSPPAAGGRCTPAVAFGGAGGAPGAGFGGRRFFGPRASGTPRPRPSGSGARRFAGARAVFGPVVSVSGTTFVVSASRPATRLGSSPSAAPTFTTTPTTVQEGPSTRYVLTEPASPSVLAVGQCVLATGATDSTGAVTARVVSIRYLIPGASCTFGAGRFRSGG